MWLFKEQHLSFPHWRAQRPYLISHEVMLTNIPHGNILNRFHSNLLNSVDPAEFRFESMIAIESFYYFYLYSMWFATLGETKMCGVYDLVLYQACEYNQ